MKNKTVIQTEKSKHNNSQIISKTNYYNSLNNSDLLTSNNFHKSKEENSKSKSKEKEKEIESDIEKKKSIDIEKEKDKDKDTEQEIEKNKILIESKSIGISNTKLPVTNIILDDKFLSKTGFKELKKKIKSDVALYQDFVIDGYKNAFVNSKKNIIERLGDCVEKKFRIIELNKIKKNEKFAKSKIIKQYQKYQKVMMVTGFINPPQSNLEHDMGLTKRMNHSHSTSHILDKKTLGGFPLLLSTPTSYEKKFSSLSEKERNEKNILALLKLKRFLNLYWKQRRELVKEFFDKYNINELYLYQDNYLDNFAHYVNDHVNNGNNLNENSCDIETRLPMIDIIVKGVKYKSNVNIKKDINDNGHKKIFKKKLNLKFNISSSTDELTKEKEYLESIISKRRIDEYRSFLNRNYKKSVTNNLLKGLSKEEKLKYFSKKKFGKVEIKDKNNLANNLKKQAFYIKRFDPNSNKYFNKSSIKYYNKDDLKRLNDELNYVSYSILKKFESDSMKKTQEKILGPRKYNGLNDKIIDKLNQRLYYTIKEKYHLNHPEVIPTQKKKLLEYIIAQKLQERKNFEDKLLKDLK